MTELSCSQCRKLAAELALNIVTGRERAAALAHLDRCDQCRRRVAELARTVDKLVELLPEQEPPAGFEQRTAARLNRPTRHTRPRVPPIAAMLLAVALAAGMSSPGFPPPASPGLSPDDPAKLGNRPVLYAPLTYHHRVVGQAYLYPGTPSWIYVAVNDARTRADHVELELARPDGSLTPVGTIELSQGQGAWGGPTSVSPDTLSAPTLVSPSGRTLATGQFSSQTAVPNPLGLRPRTQDKPARTDRGRIRERASVTNNGASKPSKLGRDWDRERTYDRDRYPTGRSDAGARPSGRDRAVESADGSTRRDQAQRHRDRPRLHQSEPLTTVRHTPPPKTHAKSKTSERLHVDKDRARESKRPDKHDASDRRGDSHRAAHSKHGNEQRVSSSGRVSDRRGDSHRAAHSKHGNEHRTSSSGHAYVFGK